ncbi:MAG: hypothetical protein RRZ83_00605 [Alistipes sp.]
MKKSVFMLLAAIGLLLGVGASAQNRNCPMALSPDGACTTMEQRVKTKTEQLRKTLSLTDKQAQQVYDVKLKYAKQRQALRAECAAQMKQILNDEQYATWEKTRNSRTCFNGAKPAPRQRMKPGAGCGGNRHVGTYGRRAR